MLLLVLTLCEIEINSFPNEKSFIRKEEVSIDAQEW